MSLGSSSGISGFLLAFFASTFAFTSASANPANGANEHNIVRSALNGGTTTTIGSFTYAFGQEPRPSPALVDMSDDTAIANTAQTHASKCVWQHSSSADRNGNGENIYASTSSSASVADAVGMWTSEVEDYTYTTNSCASGKVCGHYTQVVWDDSTKVGCAIESCAPLKNTDGSTLFGSANFIVCQYNQPGNFTGQKPYDSSPADTARPVISSFTRKNPLTASTSADSLTFLATFTEAVTGVDVADFLTTGTTGAVAVSQVSGSAYDVTVSGGDMPALNGTVGLNLAVSPSIQDAAGNALIVAEPAIDETYTVTNVSLDPESDANSVTLSGNDQPITNGDGSPTAGDNTDFGERQVGTGSIQHGFSITNNSGRDVTLSSIQIQESGTARNGLRGWWDHFSAWALLGINEALAVGAGDFTLNLNDPLPYTITNGTAYTFTIDFAPTAAGLRDGVVVITFSDGSVFRFVISGNGTVATPLLPAQNIPLFGPFGLLAMLAGLFWFGGRRRKL